MRCDDDDGDEDEDDEDNNRGAAAAASATMVAIGTRARTLLSCYTFFYLLRKKKQPFSLYFLPLEGEIQTFWGLRLLPFLAWTTSVQSYCIRSISLLEIKPDKSFEG